MSALRNSKKIPGLCKLGIMPGKLNGNSYFFQSASNYMQNMHYYMTNAEHIHLISFQIESVDKSGTLNTDRVGPEKLIKLIM